MGTGQGDKCDRCYSCYPTGDCTDRKFVLQLQKDNEVQLKYIELSIQILTAAPSESSQPVRKWAIDTINRYSEVKTDSEAENELLKQRLLRQIMSDFDKSAKETIQRIR